MVAELASWVGPTSAEVAQAEVEVGHEVGGGQVEVGQRLAVTQQTPSQGVGRILPQATTTSPNLT